MSVAAAVMARRRRPRDGGWPLARTRRDTQARRVGSSQGASSGRAAQIAFFGACALVFAGSVALTIVWAASMSAMGEMPMSGGWTMSMAWMRMPGQTWLDAATSFLGMWVVMMVAMMLPSLAPMLWRFRQAVSPSNAARAGGLTVLAGVGYFLVWTALALAVYPVGVALAIVEMQWPALARAAPIAAGVVVIVAGTLQFTAWKARQLACCRRAARTLVWTPRPNSVTAIRHGLRLGRHCLDCCAGPMAILLAIGVMDLRAMALVTGVITAERLAPAGERIAKALGIVIVAAGLLLIADSAMGIG